MISQFLFMKNLKLKETVIYYSSKIQAQSIFKSTRANFARKDTNDKILRKMLNTGILIKSNEELKEIAIRIVAVIAVRNCFRDKLINKVVNPCKMLNL